MNKRILSFLIALTFVLALPFSAGSASAATYGEGIAEEYKVLSALGFAAEGELEDFSKTVTRGEAAEYIARLFHDNLGEAEQYFKDVPPESEYFEGVWILAKMGVISGDNGYFYPDRPAEVTEAVKMIVAALGLDYVAQIKGGYPTGYMAVAQNKKIVSGLNSAGGELEAGALVHMLFKTLKSDMDASTAYDGEYQRGGESFLSKRFSIYESDGILTDNGITSLSGSSSIKEGYIKVDGEIYACKNDFAELLGRKIKFYYKEDRGEEKELLYAYPAYSDDVVTIGDELEPKFSNFEYRYYADENGSREKNARVSSSYTFIYNNAVITDGGYFKNDLTVPKMGRVELIDNNADSVYEIVKVMDYKDVVVAGADSGKQLIYGEDGELIDLGASDVKFSLKYIDGSPATFVAVSANETLLTVAESADQRYYEIIIATAAERGVYSMQKDEYITVGENEYKLSPYFSDSLTLGCEYDFYFNALGRVAQATETSRSGDGLGYLIGLSTGKSLENPKAKLFTEEYGVITVSFANRVQVADGKSLEAHKAAEFLSAGGTGVKQPVRYRLNGDDILSVLKPFAAEECLVSRMQAKSYGRLSTLTDAGGDGMTNPKQIPYDEGVKVFTVGSTDKSYSVNGAGFFPEYISPVYTVSAYATNSAYPGIADVLIIHSDGGSNGEFLDYNVDNDPLSTDHVGAHGVIVESIGRVMMDGVVVSQVQYRYGATKGYFTVEDDEALTFNGSAGRYVEGGTNECTVEPGDFVRFGRNSNSTVPAGNLLVIYDESRDVYRDFVNNYWDASYSYTNRTPWSSYSVMRVYFYDKQKDFFTLYDTPITNPLPDESHKLVRKLTGGAQVMIFDREKETLTEGNINDVLTYETAETDCTNAILYNYENDAGGYKLYIYR